MSFRCVHVVVNARISFFFFLVFTYLFWKHYKERGVGRGGRESMYVCEGQIFYLLVHSTKGCNSQLWKGWSQNPENSSRSPKLVSGVQRVETSTAFLRLWARSWLVVDQLGQTDMHMGTLMFNRGFTHHTTMLASKISFQNWVIVYSVYMLHVTTHSPVNGHCGGFCLWACKLWTWRRKSVSEIAFNSLGYTHGNGITGLYSHSNWFFFF